MEKKRVLFVLTSHGRLGHTDMKTGFHWSEMTDPYYVLTDAGVDVDIASVAGGRPPHDPDSFKDDPEQDPETVTRFHRDHAAMAKLEDTRPVSEFDISRYDAIYMPGGHGTMWDLPDSEALTRMIEDAWRSGKIIAAVCHGPAALVAARDKRGEPLVQDRRICSFTDMEERKAGKDDIVPFLLEGKLRALGAIFESAPPSQEIVVTDGPFITGQNPASAKALGETLLQKLNAETSVEAGILAGQSASPSRPNQSYPRT